MMRSVPAAALALAACAAASVAAPSMAGMQAAPVPLVQAVLVGPAIQGALVRGRVAAKAVTLALDGEPVAVDADGEFVLGFDRDAGPVAHLVQRAEDGQVLDQAIAVGPRGWRIERVDAPYRAGRTAAAFEAARPAELAAIAAARAQVTPAQGWRQRLRWPATGRLTGLFGAQRIYRGQPGGFHTGADIALPTGTPVVAPAAGVVVLAADTPFTLEGRLLIVDHGAGLSSAFLHLSRIDVRIGDAVAQGQPIAAVGATGRATGPHLHWGLRWHAARLDPLLVAGDPTPS